MEFTQEKQGDWLIVEVTGRMDATTSSEFEEQCSQWIEAGNVSIAVGMSGVEYISSAGLRSILSSAKQLKAESGELRFFGLTGMVADVFKMSGFAAMFKLFETREEALG